jgi:capsular polysaccharide biosynthesis protein
MSDIRLSSISQIPGARRLACLQAGASYRRQAPRKLLVHGDAVRQALERHYQRLVVQAPEVVLWALPDALVFGKGIIVMDGAVVQENTEGAPVPKVLEKLRQAVPEPERVIEEPILYTTRYGVLNYGHCLTDIVPRIVWALRADPTLKAALHPEFVPMARWAMWALGIDNERLVTLDERPTLLKQGLYVSPCSLHPLVHLPAALRLLRDGLLPLTDYAKELQFPRHIHVSRDDARSRHFYNHRDVVQALHGRGYEDVTTGRLTLVEQVALFAQAESIVGIAGASMTNILFAREGTPVRLMAPSTMPALYYWDIADQLGLDYGIAYFETDDEDMAQGIHASFSAPVPQVLALLD